MSTRPTPENPECLRPFSEGVAGSRALARPWAAAMEAYARQIKNPQLEADAWVIRKRTEDKLGELSAALDRDAGAAKKGTDRGRRLPANGKASKAATLKAVGISTSAANRYEQFHKLPAREKERRKGDRRSRLANRSPTPLSNRMIKKRTSRRTRTRTDVVRRLAKNIDTVSPVGHQAAGHDEVTGRVDRRQAMPRRKCDDDIAMCDGCGIRHQEKTSIRRARD